MSDTTFGRSWYTQIIRKTSKIYFFTYFLFFTAEDNKWEVGSYTTSYMAIRPLTKRTQEQQPHHWLLAVETQMLKLKSEAIRNFQQFLGSKL